MGVIVIIIIRFTILFYYIYTLNNQKLIITYSIDIIKEESY